MHFVDQHLMHLILTHVFRVESLKPMRLGAKMLILRCNLAGGLVAVLKKNAEM